MKWAACVHFHFMSSHCELRRLRKSSHLKITESDYGVFTFFPVYRSLLFLRSRILMNPEIFRASIQSPSIFFLNINDIIRVFMYKQL